MGDDIVIWNKTVALKYLRVLKHLGLEVNLSKSILSPKGKGLEFAKRTIVNGQDVSPIPFAEQSAATRSTSNAISFKRKHQISPLQLLRFLGYGYKIDPTKDNSLNRTIALALSIPRTPKEFLNFFSISRSFLD